MDTLTLKQHALIGLVILKDRPMRNPIIKKINYLKKPYFKHIRIGKNIVSLTGKDIDIFNRYMGKDCYFLYTTKFEITAQSHKEKKSYETIHNRVKSIMTEVPKLFTIRKEILKLDHFDLVFFIYNSVAIFFVSDIIQILKTYYNKFKFFTERGQTNFLKSSDDIQLCLLTRQEKSNKGIFLFIDIFDLHSVLTKMLSSNKREDFENLIEMFSAVEYLLNCNGFLLIPRT